VASVIGLRPRNRRIIIRVRGAKSPVKRGKKNIRGVALGWEDREKELMQEYNRAIKY
jgi:hypothetical protein